MARSRRSAGNRWLRLVTRSLTVLATGGALTGLLASSAGAAVAVPNPDGPGGVVLRASSAHKTGAPRSRVGVPAPFTRDSRTVRHANGSYTTTIYPHPAFYRAGSEWQPIDSTLVAA